MFLPLGPGIAGLVGYMIAQVFFGLGLGFYTCVSWAFMADAIDYNEWKNGTKEEGTVYSLHSFFRKLAQGVGPSLVVVIMAALGYKGELGDEQPMWVAQNMRWLVAALYAFSGILMFVAIKFIYNLDKKTLEIMTNELNARRALAAQATVNSETVVDTVEEMVENEPETIAESIAEATESVVDEENNE